LPLVAVRRRSLHPYQSCGSRKSWHKYDGSHRRCTDHVTSSPIARVRLLLRTRQEGIHTKHYIHKVPAHMQGACASSPPSFPTPSLHVAVHSDDTDQFHNPLPRPCMHLAYTPSQGNLTMTWWVGQGASTHGRRSGHSARRPSRSLICSVQFCRSPSPPPHP